MEQTSDSPIIGCSRAITELKLEIERLRGSDSKVLITGDSGVGKELVARAIGTSQPRPNAPFIPVNCAGIPATLLESELFGHVKGSFTGAYRDSPGKLEMASNGSIFLDEVGEMPLHMQGLLLRFLETGEIQTVGADRPRIVKRVRVIAATNRSLPHLIAQGVFREDLFYRLNVIHLVVPPLRQRREDIPLLIAHILHRLVDGDDGGPRPTVQAIAPEAVAALAEYSWPGNVRELQNVLQRLVVSGRREMIELDDLPPEVRTRSTRGARSTQERRRSVADDLFEKLIEDRESFWTVVYPPYMNREITRATVRDLVHRGLEETRGSYRILLRLFNMDAGDYRRFLNFLRKHDCHLPFTSYRQ
jgi:transcriptional regulator with PAS, ATPase and Fis domain